MRNSFIWAVALLLGVTMAYPAANAGAQTKKKVTVPAGTRILIRTVDPIDSSKQKTGYRFTTTLEHDRANYSARAELGSPFGKLSILTAQSEARASLRLRKSS